MDLPYVNVHFHAVHGIHDKPSILGRHRTCRTWAAAWPGAAYPCFWDSSTPRHTHKEKTPLATSSVRQIKPPNDSCNTNSPPPLPAVRTHPDAYAHTLKYTYTATYMDHISGPTNPYRYITKIRLNLSLLLLNCFYSYENGVKKIKVSCKWQMMYGTNTISTKILQSLQQFSRESHRRELSDESVLRTTTEHNLKNMPGKQLYRNKKPKWSQASSRIDPQSE